MFATRADLLCVLHRATAGAMLCDGGKISLELSQITEICYLSVYDVGFSGVVPVAV